MDQPESPIKHGRDNIKLGPTTFQSGVEYVRTESKQAYEHPPLWPSLQPEPTLPPPIDPKLHEWALVEIIERLGRIQSQLDTLSTYIHLPWYKRLRMWIKDNLHV